MHTALQHQTVIAQETPEPMDELLERFEAAFNAGDYAAVLDKLRGGWVQRLRRNEPMGSVREAAHVQEVEENQARHR